MQEAYIIAGYRTAVGKAGKGGFKTVRPDDLGIAVIQRLMADFPQLEPARVDDVIVAAPTPKASRASRSDASSPCAP